mgnify:CR=1 FL=1
MRRERLVVDDFVEPAVWLVVDAHPALFLHHFAFVGERVLVDAAASPSGRPSSHRMSGRYCDGTVSQNTVIVVVGVGVGSARRPTRDERRVAFGLDVLRSLEHQVLEEMRETGASRLLVLRADVIPELQMDDWRRVILGQDHRQAVWQRQQLVLKFWVDEQRPRAPGTRRPGSARSTVMARSFQRLRIMRPIVPSTDEAKPGERP